MPSLIATPALQGLTPVTHGALTLGDATPARITSVAPFRGQAEAVGRALAPLGLRFPAPNAVIEGAGGRIVWTGPGQAFLLDADPAPLAGLAALTDQSDGWVGLRLSGMGCEEALARLIPIDLRPDAFGPGAAARAPLGHMPAVVMRAGAGAETGAETGRATGGKTGAETGIKTGDKTGAETGIEILVFRSMARSAVHEIGGAMAGLAARRGG